MQWFFLQRANIAAEHGCARQLTWQLAENNPAQEESNHVIMHTHVAWVKIKPYSSLAASLLSCLSPSRDMASVQPGSQERCHGFHGVPKSGRLETRARCSAAPHLALAFPQIISSVLMPGVWNFFAGWECRREQRLPSTHQKTPQPPSPPPPHSLNTIPCCVHGIGNHLLIHAF